MKHTTSHEEPHRVVHEVIRPIIQEVHEIIQPYRRIVQQVEPVIEEIRTVVAKDAGKQSYGNGEGGGSGYGGKAAPYEDQPMRSHLQPSSSPRHHVQPQPRYMSQGPRYRTAALYEPETAASSSSPKKLSSVAASPIYNPVPSASNTHNKFNYYVRSPQPTQNNHHHHHHAHQQHSKVYLNQNGVPVFQSNYIGPAYELTKK